MSASGEDIRVVNCAILRDGQTNVDRNIVIFEYNLPPPLVPMRSAFYQSSGSTLTTYNILTGTYFPFYGSTVSPLDETQNTLMKATIFENDGTLFPKQQMWKKILRQYREYDYEIVKTFIIDNIKSLDFEFISTRDEIFKRFTHFYELKISALIGSEWWSRGGTTQIIKTFVLSHVWNGEQFIYVGPPTHTLNEMIDKCFEENKVALPDNNEKINDFLNSHGVNNVLDPSFQDIILTYGHQHNTRGTPNKIFHSHRTGNKPKFGKLGSRNISTPLHGSVESKVHFVKTKVSHGLGNKDTKETNRTKKTKRTKGIEGSKGTNILPQNFSVNFNNVTKGGANTRKKGRNNKNKNKSKRRKHSSSRRRHRSH